MTPSDPIPDVFAADFCQNPYPAYEALRKINPVYLDRTRNLWIISRYADVRRVLQSSVEFSSRNASFEHTLLGVDGDAHVRAQRIVSQNLSENLGTLKQYVDRCVNTAVSKMGHQGHGEIVADLAIYLPVSVALQLLGIDASKWEDVSRCANALLEAGNVFLSPNERAIHRQYHDEFRMFLRDHFGRRRERNGLTLTRLFGDESGLALEERVDLGMLMMGAAILTTTSLIASAVYVMLGELAVLAKLREDASLIPLFIEEVLRCESPVQRTPRTVAHDTVIAGQPLPAGSELLLLLGAANRDDDKFSQAECFDIHRQPNEHLSFGFGAHRCLGRTLARLEAIPAITAIVGLDAVALVDRTEAVQYRRNLVIRSPQQLRVICRKQDAAHQ